MWMLITTTVAACSSAYVYVEPSVVQHVYVTPSGYLIKRTEKKLMGRWRTETVVVH